MIAINRKVGLKKAPSYAGLHRFYHQNNLLFCFYSFTNLRTSMLFIFCLFFEAQKELDF